MSTNKSKFDFKLLAKYLKNANIKVSHVWLRKIDNVLQRRRNSNWHNNADNRDVLIVSINRVLKLARGGVSVYLRDFLAEYPSLKGVGNNN